MNEAERILVQLGARSFLGTARDEELLDALQQPFDGSRLVEIAAREGVAGIVAAELRRVAASQGSDALPLELFSRAVQPVFAHTGAHFSELLRLGDGLENAGLRVIVLKGGALIDTVYQRRLALRPVSDIDLLVDPADLAGVEAVLRARGFLQPSSSPHLFNRGRLAFDLHADITSSARIRRRSLAFHPTSRRLWNGARPFGSGSRSLLVLSDVHQFLHSSIHALKHSYSRLIWLVDLALLLPRVDCDEAIAEADASGTSRAVSYTSHLLRRMLGVEPPTGWSESCPSLNTFERIFVAGVERRSEASTTGELVVAFSIPSWRDRVGYVCELALPRRAVLTEQFPRTPLWLLLPRRCARMVLRGLVKLLRILGNVGPSRSSEAPVK